MAGRRDEGLFADHSDRGRCNRAFSREGGAVQHDDRGDGGCQVGDKQVLVQVGRVERASRQADHVTDLDATCQKVASGAGQGVRASASNGHRQAGDGGHRCEVALEQHAEQVGVGLGRQLAGNLARDAAHAMAEVSDLEVSSLFVRGVALLGQVNGALHAAKQLAPRLTRRDTECGFDLVGQLFK